MASKASENKDLSQIQPARKEKLPALILLDLADRGWMATSQLRHKILRSFQPVQAGEMRFRPTDPRSVVVIS